MATENCALCGKSRAAHAGLNHHFTLTGDLTQKEPTPPTPPTSIDVILRLALIDKGIITAEDLALKEAQVREQLRSLAAPVSKPGDGE